MDPIFAALVQETQQASRVHLDGVVLRRRGLPIDLQLLRHDATGRFNVAEDSTLVLRMDYLEVTATAK